MTVEKVLAHHSAHLRCSTHTLVGKLNCYMVGHCCREGVLTLMHGACCIYVIAYALHPGAWCCARAFKSMYLLQLTVAAAVG